MTHPPADGRKVERVPSCEGERGRGLRDDSVARHGGGGKQHREHGAGEGSWELDE